MIVARFRELSRVFDIRQFFYFRQIGCHFFCLVTEIYDSPLVKNKQFVIVELLRLFIELKVVEDYLETTEWILQKEMKDFDKMHIKIIIKSQKLTDFIFDSIHEKLQSIKKREFPLYFKSKKDNKKVI